MNTYEHIQTVFEANASTETAEGMKAYMRDQFEYYGIPTPLRRKLYAEHIKAAKKGKVVDWALIDQAYNDPHREFQYFAYDYLLGTARFLEFGDLIKIRQLILRKPWWDTIDALCKVVGRISDTDDRVHQEMLEWATQESIWVRRTAIQYQLTKKELTNNQTLDTILTSNLGDTEFFINKAIGWALRDYSKTNPDWVARFIEDNKDGLSALSIREGSKYL